MYRILETIKINGFYTLENYTPNLNDLNLIIDFLNKDNITEKSLISFTKYHNNYILILLKFMPISVLLNAYLDYNFLINHMSTNLYNYILMKSNERFNIKLFLGKDYISELIKLNDYFNDIYNFTNNYLLNRLTNLKHILKFIDWDNYYIGSNIILSFANKKQTNYINLFPKNNIIKLKQSSDNKAKYYKDPNNNYICEYDNFLIMINSKYYQNIGEILFETDIIVCDDLNIYCKFETYQKLETQLNNTIQSINKETLIQLKGFTASFTKYKYKKLQLSYCYVCKQYYDNELTYDRYTDMCLNCGKFNYDKRIKTADLSTCVAFVSGIRQKIGLQIALKLLRGGAKVIGTTRFINATYYNYAHQPDFDKWKNNLIISQCDFLNLSSVKKLIHFLKTQKINIFINNACQTIRPSNYYYDKLNLLECTINATLSNNLIKYTCDSHNLIEFDSDSNNMQLIPYANNNQIILYKCNTTDELLLVKNKIEILDIKFNQFNDIKDINIKNESSWNQNIEDIDTGEILEATIINQTIPTLLISQLKKHMLKPKFIIQVTCLEGTFNISKQSTHAHTNMCKSAMNMLIRTIAEEKETDQFIYSINPGFISGVNPQQDHYPLSDEDGATRILYPIIEYYNGTPLDKDWIHLSNYQPMKW